MTTKLLRVTLRPLSIPLRGEGTYVEAFGGQKGVFRKLDGRSLSSLALKARKSVYLRISRILPKLADNKADCLSGS